MLAFCSQGAQTENSPFVYYTPSYGYAQSPYNPYNPYIPGAIIGSDSPFVGAQQYYTFPSYENPSPSSAYLPMAVQSRSEIIANNTTDPFIDSIASTANRADGPGLKHHLSSASPAFTSTVKGPTSSRTSSSSRIIEGNQGGAGSNKRSLVQGNVTPGGFSNPSSLILQVRSISAYYQVKSFFSNTLSLSVTACSIKYFLSNGNEGHIC